MITPSTERPRLLIQRRQDQSPSQRSFPLHAHEQYELLLFLAGDVTYLVEGRQYHPLPGDLFLFPIAQTHRVLINSNQPYERMFIQIDRGLLGGFDPDGSLRRAFAKQPAGEVTILRTDSFRDDFWLQCLRRLPDTAGGESDETLTVLFFLLREIARGVQRTPDKPEDASLSAQIVQYINTHLTEDITPAGIAERFFISRTALYALFRATTGTCVHEYINLKRLLLARELLAAGQSPTAVYLQCGFQDYSTFYRSYKKRFAEPPAHLAKQGR